jgi:threonine dehydrogenase-like Zn-dependent dehydrogenase
MRALVLTGPHQAIVQEVDAPIARPDEVVVDVERVGVCGTDVELFTGEMSYLQSGRAHYPIRPGHEWAGTISAVGEDVDAMLLGRRATGDTMLGCGACERCAAGRHHVCAHRAELGVLGDRSGAIAEQLAVPASSLFLLPPGLDAEIGALVEPGGNAYRAVRAAGVVRGERLLVIGTATIGLLVAMFARAEGVEVHLQGRSSRSMDFARSLGFDGVWSVESLPGLRWDAVVDASNSPQAPARAIELVEPGRTVVYVGLAGSPSNVDARSLTLADVTVAGILGASSGLGGAIDAYASGRVDPRPLIDSTVGLGDVRDVLAGRRAFGAAPKVLIDPTR